MLILNKQATSCAVAENNREDISLLRDDVMFRSHGNKNHENTTEMIVSFFQKKRRVTKGDNISGDALIDKISDIFLLQTEAAKKTLDFQVAGSRTGSIGTVLTATTGANGTITFTVTVATGDTWGSYKIKDGARLNIINGTTNAVRGAVAIVVDPGGRHNCLLHL